MQKDPVWMRVRAPGGLGWEMAAGRQGVLVPEQPFLCAEGISTLTEEILMVQSEYEGQWYLRTQQWGHDSGLELGRLSEGQMATPSSPSL